MIGGGWAGIAAVVELTARLGDGRGVQIFEAGRRLGGRARAVFAEGDLALLNHAPLYPLGPSPASGKGAIFTTPTSGRGFNPPSPACGRGAGGEGSNGHDETSTTTLDEGQHILLGAYRETLDLMRRIGVNPETVLQRLPLTIQDNRGFCLSLPRLPAPLHLAAGLLMAKGIGWGEKFRALKFAPALHNAPNDGQSAAEWLAAHGQNSQLRERLWNPLCLAALNIPAERASARIFWNVLNDSLNSPDPGATDLLLPRVSLSALLPDPAADWLHARGVQIHFGQRIRRLEAMEEGGWRLFHREGVTTCRNVILAVAPQHLPALLEGSGVSLPAYDYEPIGTVYLRYPPQVALPFPLMALSGGVGQWLIDRGGGLLAASLSGRGAWTALPKAELIATLHREILSCIASQVDAECPPPSCHVTITRRATFSCTPGLARVPSKTRWPTLWIAGDHTWQNYPATLEGAVRSGLWAARRILEAQQTIA